MKLTRQGVRDLNPPRHNGNVSRGRKHERCPHMTSEWRTVGSYYDRYWYEIPIKSRVCISCGREVL